MPKIQAGKTTALFQCLFPKISHNADTNCYFIAFAYMIAFNLQIIAPFKNSILFYNKMITDTWPVIVIYMVLSK